MKYTRYTAHGNPAAADCVIGCSFGFRAVNQLVTPGIVNQELARFIAKNCADKPLILQFEIDDALQAMLPPTAARQTALRIEKETTSYLETRDLLLKAQAFMAARGYKTALLVGQTHHIARIDAICRKLGVETIVPEQLPALWDSASRQWWTRSPLSWRLREPAVILHHTVKRWV